MDTPYQAELVIVERPVNPLMLMGITLCMIIGVFGLMGIIPSYAYMVHVQQETAVNRTLPNYARESQTMIDLKRRSSSIGLLVGVANLMVATMLIWSSIKALAKRQYQLLATTTAVASLFVVARLLVCSLLISIPILQEGQRTTLSEGGYQFHTVTMVGHFIFAPMMAGFYMLMFFGASRLHRIQQQPVAPIQG